MKSSAVIALASAARAACFVLPDQHILAELQAKVGDDKPQEIASHATHTFDSLCKDFFGAKDRAEQAFDDAAAEAYNALTDDEIAALSESSDGELASDPLIGSDGHRRHHDLTLYQIISKSKHTTKFAELVDQFDDIRDALNSTDGKNITLFVPSNEVFEKIPDHAKEPPKEFLEAVLAYHVSPAAYPVKHLLAHHTIPTALIGRNLSSEGWKTPQRISVKLGFKGVYLNSHTRVVFPNVYGKNGVIHGVDDFLVPPPSIAQYIGFFPAAFSTLELAIIKTGLSELPTAPHLGATLFAPPNYAWQKLGPRINAFLFSKFGLKYLKGLVQYHIVVNQTLYSDVFYDRGPYSRAVPTGRYHLDLPTLLGGKTVGVDVGRFGRFINVHVNHYSRVIFQDGIASDGVLQVVNNILVPPRKHGGDGSGDSMSVEDFKERLAPFVDAEDDIVPDDSEAEPDWDSMEL